MPFLPIDLQTVFSQMNSVGREQAVQRDLPPQNQTFVASQIVQETRQQDTSVNQTRDVGSGLESIREEKQREGKKRKSADQKEETATSERDEKFFRDPALGTHVDIVG